MRKPSSDRWSLQIQVLALIVPLAACVLILTNWVTTQSSVRTIEKALESEVANLAQRVVEIIEPAPSEDLTEVFRRQALEILEIEPNITRLDIYVGVNGQPRLLESSSSHGDRVLESREIEAFLAKRTDTFLLEKQREIFAVRPLRLADGRSGFITVVSSLQAVDEILATNSRIRTYSLLATTLCLAVPIIWLFRRTVYRSVRHLIDVMYLFRGGDTRVRASESLSGELGELARNLNYMLEEMEKFSGHLQAEVETATSKLLARNDDLEQLNQQLHETQTRLTQAERLALVGQLTATFAHEVGSPLSAISTHLQILLEESSLEAKVRNRVLLASEQIDRICQIVENLLASSRRGPNFVSVELADVAKQIIHLLEPTFSRHQISFELQLPSHPLWVHGDAGQLQQLLLNLLNNSVDAMQGSGSIRLEISAETDRPGGKPVAQIQVFDTGHGIEEQRLLWIFDAFSTSKELGKGTGLGLTVCKEIVNRHHGRIWVNKTSEEGTCFVVQLPLKPILAADRSRAKQKGAAVHELN